MTAGDRSAGFGRDAPVAVRSDPFPWGREATHERVGVAVLFEVAVSPAPGASEVTVVAVTGELDVSSAPRLRQEIVSLASSGRTLLVVDLAGVDFLDSTGLGVLLGALKRVRAAGGELALCRAEPQVAKVFDITRLSDILTLHPSVDEAVAAVCGA